MPPYSSTLNPIERLWSLVKNQWRKAVLIRNAEALSMQQARQMIEDIMMGVTR